MSTSGYHGFGLYVVITGFQPIIYITVIADVAIIFFGFSWLCLIMYNDMPR